MRQIAAKIPQNSTEYACENRAYVVTIYKNVFKDFCIGNTVRYKEVVGTAMFWHIIKAQCFVLCVLGEVSA